MRYVNPNPLRDSLARSLWASAPPTPKKPPSGPGKGRHGHHPTKESDKVLLEVRRLRETLGFMPAKIRQRMANLGAEMTLNRVNQIINYQVRAHLVPDQTLRPYWPE